MVDQSHCFVSAVFALLRQSNGVGLFQVSGVQRRHAARHQHIDGHLLRGQRFRPLGIIGEGECGRDESIAAASHPQRHQLRMESRRPADDRRRDVVRD